MMSPREFTSQALGHRNLTTTNVYLDSFSTSVLDRVAKNPLIMSMTINMPLGDLINKSLRGEAAVRESWLFVYVKRLTDGDKGKLRQALKVVDAAIIMWKSKYFYFYL